MQEVGQVINFSEGKMINEKKLIEDIKEWNKEREIKWTSESVISLLESAPKIGEWIPCSERLPEIMHPVLVCDEQGNVCVRTITCEIKGKKYWSQDKYDVIAWQPLPEPYILGKSELGLE